MEGSVFIDFIIRAIQHDRFIDQGLIKAFSADRGWRIRRIAKIADGLLKLAFYMHSHQADGTREIEAGRFQYLDKIAASLWGFILHHASEEWPGRNSNRICGNRMRG
jgi:hypothetical protein